MVTLCVLLLTLTAFVSSKKYDYPKKYEVDYFITTYANGAYDITGYKPETSNPDGYPLHIFVQGTQEDPESAWSETVQQYATYMAERGVVSASIWYNNAAYPPACAGFHTKAQSMFDFGDPQTAISVLCNQDSGLDIDCSKGIVAHGISQGAQIVLLSGFYAGNENITAINPLAGGTTFVGDCLFYENLRLDQSKIRSRVGVNDAIFCRDNESCRSAQSTITGYICPNQVQCMQEDGSGWYIVQASETASGKATHCYMLLESECQDVFDANYYPDCTDCDWSLEADLGWMLSRLNLQ